MIFNNQSFYFKDGVVNFENVKFQDLIPSNFDKEIHQILITRPDAEGVASIVTIDEEGFDPGDYILDLLGHPFAIAIAEVIPHWKFGDPISNMEITFSEMLEPLNRDLSVKVHIAFTSKGEKFVYRLT